MSCIKVVTTKRRIESAIVAQLPISLLPSTSIFLFSFILTFIPNFATCKLHPNSSGNFITPLRHPLPLQLFKLPFSPLHPHFTRRYKRDETEHSGGAFGRGIGFFVGEPCKDQCNAILFHIYCNSSTQKCECQPQFPVNIDNRICVRALNLGESCEYDESCKYQDAFSFCHSEERKCRCQENYHPFLGSAGLPECVLGRAVFVKSQYIGTFTIVAGASFALVVLLLVIWCSFRRFSKPRLTSSDIQEGYMEPSTRSIRRGNGRILSGDRMAMSREENPFDPSSSSLPQNITSISHDFLSPSERRASYSMLVPPPLIEVSRRMSGSETPTSLRSYSSFRSQSSFRRYRTSDVNVRTGRTFITTDPSPILPHPPSNATLPCNHLSLSEHHPLHVSRKTPPVPGLAESLGQPQQHPSTGASGGRPSSERGELKEQTSCII